MKYLIITIIGLIALILLGTVLLVVISPDDTSDTAAPTDIDSETEVPANMPSAPAVSISQPQTIPLNTTATRVLNAPSVVQDPANQGDYILYGEAACATSDCDTAAMQDLSITYDLETDSFSVVLFAEPLGATREKAKNILINSVGFSEQELCTLNITVSIPYWVSESLAGVNVGFMGCPNAVQL